MTNLNQILPRTIQPRMKPRKNRSRIKTKNIQLRMILALKKRAFHLMLTGNSKMETKKKLTQKGSFQVT